MASIFLDRFITYFNTWFLIYIFGVIVCFGFIYKLRYVRVRKIQKQPSAPKLEIRQLLHAVVYAFTLSIMGLGLVYLIITGRTKLDILPENISLIWTLFGVVIYLIGFDFYFYFFHRLMHTKLFYPFHKLHHSVETPTVLTVFCVHPVEVFILYLYHILFITVIPTYPHVLAISALFIHQGNLTGHLGFELFPKSFSQKFPLISTATYHDLHHQKINVNYGYFFLFLDRFFKTSYADYQRVYQAVFETNSVRKDIS